MKIETTQMGDVTVVAFTGEMDAFNLPEVSRQVDGMVERGQKKLVLNMKHVTFLNSSALGYLLQLRKKAKAAGGDALIAEPSTFVRKLIATVRLEKLFDIHADAYAAVRVLWGEQGVAAGEISPEKVDETLLGLGSVVFTVTLDGKPRKFVGKIASLYGDGLKLRWDVPKGTAAQGFPLSASNFDQVVKAGTAMQVKFRQPLLAQDRHFDIKGKVLEVARAAADEGRDEASVTVHYDELEAPDVVMLRQHVADLDRFRQELGPGR